MITPTSAWTTEFAKRNRKPLYLVQIESYHYAFSNHAYNPGTIPTPTGSLMTSPRSPVSPERVQWSFPTMGTAAIPSASDGTSEANNDGSGFIHQTGTGPFSTLFNLYYEGWTIPSLPSDAIVTAIYPVLLYSHVTTAGDPTDLFLQTGTTPGGFWSGLTTHHTGSSDVDHFQDYDNSSLGTDITILSDRVIRLQGQQTIPSTSDCLTTVHQVAIAIYYTSASEDAGTSTGGSWSKPWLRPAPDDLELTVDDLNGSATLGQLSFTVLDLERLDYPILADMPTFVFEGKAITLKVGTASLDYPDLQTFYTGVIESVSRNDLNTGWTFTCNDGSANLDSVIWTVGDDGAPTDSDHPKTILGNPIDILLSILEDDLSIDPARIDVARIEAYRDTYFAGMNFLFTITGPPQARDFIQKQLMVPLGGILWINNLGVHTVRFMAPLDGDTDPVMSLTKRDLSSTPIAGQADLINTISFRFDKNDSGSSSSNNDFLSISIQRDSDSITKYGLYGEHIIESDGLRASSQGFFIASFVARMIFLRYGNKNLTFTADGQWKLALLEPFDLIQVTHPQVPDRVNGVFGITDWLLQVLDRTYMFGDGKVSLRVVDASEMSKYGRYKIAPDGLAVWTSASPTEQARYMYLSEDSGLMSNGDVAPILG